jgi:signal transduction histidine kinase
MLTLLANEFTAPLNSLHALLTTLLDGDHGEVAPPVREVVQDVAKTHDRLRRVATDVLDAARIEAGQVTASIQHVPIKSIVTQAVEALQGEAKKKGLSVVCEFKEEEPVAVDPQHAERVLTAVIHNAIHYTEKGTVKITCMPQREQIAITVADTGVGMQTGQLVECFTKPRIGTLLHGRGMSLYLARQLAKLMGGDVTLVSSELGTGSTFAVLFPKALASKAPVADTKKSGATAGARR